MQVCKAPYDDFIAWIKQQKYNESELPNLCKHRILPGFKGGTYEEENVVFLTVKQHIAAHRYRYWQYGEKADKDGCTVLLGLYNAAVKKNLTPREYYQQLGTKAQKVHKEQGIVFYDKKFQKKIAIQEGKKRSENMIKINEMISKNDPGERSRAGKIGGKAVSAQQKETKTHFYDPSHSVQKKGNLYRWGTFICGFGRVAPARDYFHPRFLFFWEKMNSPPLSDKYPRKVYTFEEYLLVVEHEIKTVEDFFSYKSKFNVADPPNLLSLNEREIPSTKKISDYLTYFPGSLRVLRTQRTDKSK